MLRSHGVNKTSPDEFFIRDKWIGKRISYSANSLPLCVVLARCDEEIVPIEFQKFYPLSSLSFQQYIRIPLPDHSYALSSFTSERWFSNDVPDTRTMGELWKLLTSRPLPTSGKLTRLYGDFGQFWLNGARSIRDPRFNSGKERLPLWVLTAWHDMVNFAETQSSLEKAYRSLQELIKQKPVANHFPTVDSVFRNVKWNQSFKHGGVTISAYEFAPLLRQVMLSDTVTQVWVPVLREKHEVVIKIDFGARTVGYGDTLPGFSPPRVVAEHIHSWIKLRYKINFSWVGKAIVEHGIQEDSISCILGTANMTAHAIWGDELWSIKERMLDRVRWFVNLTTPAPASRVKDTEEPTPVDAPATVIQNRTRPDISNLIHAQSNVELIMNEELLDTILMFPNAVVLNNMGEEKVLGKKKDESEGRAADKSKSSKSSGALNSAWASFMRQKKEVVAGPLEVSKNDKKRSHSPNPVPDLETIDVAEADQPPKRHRDNDFKSILGPTGNSLSAQAEKRYTAELDAGVFNEGKINEFKRSCLMVDKHAEFNANHLRSVRCSNCGCETICQGAKGAPNPRRFKDHYRKCVAGYIHLPKTQAHVKNTSTLISGAFQGFQKLSTNVSCILGISKANHQPEQSFTSPPVNPTPLPCPAITEADNPSVLTYLQRSSALGGGSHSVTKIALELFHKPFILLTASQKAQVLDRQDIFVTETGRVLPCNECHKVSRSSKFLKALRSKAPDTRNLKYIPKKYQNKLLAHQWAASNGLKELVESVTKRQRRSD
ncbi:hypothetical protein EV359DRAFT_85928 [Lentinula novae-zelandiae]|nr:hypothetical protein EV359DRAFT_85928 [Lentinula novae-zelandiae]